MKTIANILTTAVVDIFCAAILVACALTHLYVIDYVGDFREMEVIVSIPGTLLFGYIAICAVITLVIKDWQGFAAMITFLILGWGTLILSQWLLANGYTELSALVFAMGIILTPAMAAGIAQEVK